MVTWFSNGRFQQSFPIWRVEKQHGLADTILRNSDQLYVCMKLIENGKREETLTHIVIYTYIS